MIPFSLFLALKYLRPKRSFISVVTIISVVGVLLGVAILIIVLSVMTGFDNMWRQKILSFKPHLTVVSTYGVIEDDEELCRKIEKVPGITGAAPVVTTMVLMHHNNRIAAPIVLGIDPDRARKVSRVTEFVRGGRKFDLEGKKTVVGVDLAMQTTLKEGAKVLVYSPRNVMSKDEVYLPEELTVSGIFDMGMAKFDSGYILTSLELARDLVGMKKGAHAIYVMTEDPFKFMEFAARVSDAIDPAYRVITWQEEDSMLFAVLSNEKSMMFVLLVFITIVAIFCVTNTLIVITVQKTNEIGLLKALGFQSGRIMAAFVWHGWIQCLIGTIAGIAVGLLVLNNLQSIVDWLNSVNVPVFPKEIYQFSRIPWEVSYVEVAKIALLVMVFCTLSSILPAWRAARLDPVQALRHE